MKKFLLLILLITAALLPIACSDSTKQPATETAQTTDQPNDATLTIQVKAKFTDDELVKARNIDVDTQNGVVTLQGAVGSQSEADRAVEIAKNTEGVQRVESNLQVDATLARDLGDEIEEGTEAAGEKAEGLGDEAEKLAEQGKETASEIGDTIADTASDATITTTVKVKLADDDVVKARNIDVDTKDNVVTLNGTVNSKKEAARAIQIARSVKNVKDVHSNLVVRAETGT